MAENAEIVKLIYEFGKYPVLVQRKLKKIHPEAPTPSTQQIKRLVVKFESIGTVNDRRKENCGRPTTLRSQENIVKVQRIVEDTPRISIRNVMRDITNTRTGPSYGTTLMMWVFDVIDFDDVGVDVIDFDDVGVDVIDFDDVGVDVIDFNDLGV
ncbi:hypothetical protein ACF0H5_013902 [Mactra antiquata]